MPTHDQIHTTASGVAKIIQHAQFMVNQCLKTTQAIEMNIERLSSGKPGSMLQGYLDLEAVLGSLGTQIDETLQTISTIHGRTPYPRPIDNLPEEILSYVFRLGVAEVVKDGSVGVRSQTLHCEDASGSRRLALPEILGQVSRYWRRVAMGTPVIWSRIVWDQRSSLFMEESPRAHRRLTLSQQSPLCVTWNVGTSVFEPHAERIEALHLEVESGIYYIIDLLVLMAPSKRLHILYIESNHDFPDESYGSTFWAKGPSDGFSALRYLTLDNVALGWSWPIRNLLFLRLRKLRIVWPELCEVLVSSPDLEILSLNYISMQGWNPTASHHETVVFPVHYNLRTLIISYNTYLAHAGYTTGSILPFIRASNITKLTVFVRGGSTEGLGLGILVSNARESLEDISIGLPTISNLDDALIAITDPPTSAYESLDPNKSTRGHGGRQLSAPYRYQHISGGEL